MKKTKQTAKQKKTQQILIGVLVVVILIALYLKFRKPKDSNEVSISSGGTSNTPTSSGMKRVGNDTVLKYGTKAEEVKWVQTLYNSIYAVPLGKTKLTVDGIYGTKTQAAVKFVLGKTTTSWTEFKRFVDNKPTPSSTATDGNIFINPLIPQTEWPWEVQP